MEVKNELVKNNSCSGDSCIAFMLKMELLSDGVPGGGEGLAGIIDTDISYDEYGIPYIPSKRIKGILRESAQELKEADLLSQNIDSIFGKGGQEKGVDFRIDNGYWEKYQKIKELLRYTNSENSNKRVKCIFNKEGVLEYFTYSRAQTSIDGKTGTAKENTLRIVRVLRKGLVFYFTGICPQQQVDNLKNIAKVTRHFGANRTRGLGHIRLEFISENDDKYSVYNSQISSCFSEHQPIQGDILSVLPSCGLNEGEPSLTDNSLCCIPFEIENIGQLLVNTQVGENQVSEKFIYGGKLLSALAWEFIREKKKKDSNFNPSEDTDFQDIFKSEKVVFENAYISGKEGIFYPSPLSIVKEKDKEKYYDMAYGVDNNGVYGQSLQTKGGIGDFCVILSNGDTKTLSVSEEVEYHHRRPEDKSKGHAGSAGNSDADQGVFFQFEVVSPNQKFKGEIVGEYQYLKKLSKILSPIMILYIGKSRTAQYGKCRVKFGNDDGMNKLVKEKTFQPQKWNKGENLVITLKSDMILLNENGFPVSDAKEFKKELIRFLLLKNSVIKEGELKDPLPTNGGGLEEDTKSPQKFPPIEIVNSFCKYKKMGGFLGVWNLPKIQLPALSSGSVMVFRNNTGQDLDISGLEQASFGTRREEGFGQIHVNWHGNTSITKQEPKRNILILPENIKDIKDFIKFILRRRIKVKLKSQAMTKVKKFKSLSDISPSFLGRFLLMIKGSSDFNNLIDKLCRLRERGKSQLGKIKEDVCICESETSTQVKFKEIIQNELDSGKSQELRDILSKIGLSEDFYNDKLFELYQEYVIDYISGLKYEKRRGK